MLLMLFEVVVDFVKFLYCAESCGNTGGLKHHLYDL